MNFDDIQFIFPNNDDDLLNLKNLCVLDCETEVGTISLMLDQKKPYYLFISIEGELRKCVDLKESCLTFHDESEVMQFLEEISDSNFMDELIEIETNLDEGWKEL